MNTGFTLLAFSFDIDFILSISTLQFNYFSSFHILIKLSLVILYCTVMKVLKWRAPFESAPAKELPSLIESHELK